MTARGKMALRSCNGPWFLQRAVGKVLPHYVHHRNYVNKGNSEITTLRHIVQIALIAKVAYSELPLWVMFILGVVIVLSYWCVGWFWDKNKGYDIEIEWGNRRNPFAREVRRKL